MNYSQTDRLQSVPNWLLILSSGLLTVASFPPLPLGFLAYISLIPLMLLFLKEDYHLGFEKGYLFGLLLNLGIMYWLAFNQGTDWYWATLSMLAGVLFLALNYGLIGFLVGFIGRRWGPLAGLWSWPVVWVAVEYLRSFGKMGFTWNNLCYSQSQATQLIQFVSITGANGVSFLVVLINVLLITIWLQSGKNRRRIPRPVVAIVGLFLLLEIFGIWQLRGVSNREPRRKVHVSLIQPNVDPNEKWDRDSFYTVMQLLHDLSDSSAIEPRDLIVWPETATPTYLRKNRGRSLDRIYRHLEQLDSHLLTGVPDFEFEDDETYKVYNATFLLRPHDQRIESYRKMKLVPFGEYIPLAELFPNLNNLNLGQGLFQPGTEATVFHIPLKVDSLANQDTTLDFSSVICFESTFPYIVRQGIRNGAELLAIVTNDAWYGNNSAPYLHMQIARFRAIENRVSVVRSANTGISCICDGQGRVLTQLGFGETGWLSAELEQGGPQTFYTRFGNWFGVLNVIALCVLLGFSLMRRK
ncbi:apolipoprotein N-acyltransferase [bacterium]|nr:apolipoprotein N-acyltransferase [bacterium]MBU1633852.1 apolipoprotein N-acyltransferase [bacterium]MBU1872939.1 apolipoprotein N-acyltransferase [bacterium]